MNGLFQGCSSLETVNLSGFDTSQVTSMQLMFYGCISLKSLDLNNFDTSNLKTTYQMFYSCSSLLFLNLQKFYASSVSTYSEMFYQVENLIYCADVTTMNSNIKNLLSGYQNNCTHLCFLNSKSKYIEGKNEYIDHCYNDNTYIYEFNNNCYKSCPDGTYISHKNNFTCEENIMCDRYYNYDKTDCLEEIPEGYYLNLMILMIYNHKTLTALM